MNQGGARMHPVTGVSQCVFPLIGHPDHRFAAGALGNPQDVSSVETDHR
jgi:hypothetical protein